MGQKRQIQLETDWYHQRMDSNWYGGNDYGDKPAEDYKSESISMLVYQKLVYLK
jgi:hypothetical protein